MDAPSGDVRARSPGLFGGGHERSGNLPGVRTAPGTVRKMLTYSVPPGYRCPKLEPYTGVIHAIPGS